MLCHPTRPPTALQVQIHAIIKPKAQVVDLSKSVVMPDRELTVVQQIVPDTPSDAADSVRLEFVFLIRC